MNPGRISTCPGLRCGAFSISARIDIRSLLNLLITYLCSIYQKNIKCCRTNDGCWANEWAGGEYCQARRHAAFLFVRSSNGDGMRDGSGGGLSFLELQPGLIWS